MQEQDSLRRFIFEDEHIRGLWVCCHASYQAVMSRHPYPPVVGTVLGQALAASALLAATIKFEGSLTLQMQSEESLRLLLAQCTHDLHLRGLAHYQEDELSQANSEFNLPLQGRLMITIEQNQPHQRYQGVVESRGEALATMIEQYFQQSEQLPTRLWLASNEKIACGLLLQTLPNAGEVRPEAWDNITMLTETLTPEELLKDPCEALLLKLYNEHKVRLFESQLVSFRCRCSTERMENAIKMMSYEEANSLLSAHQQIVVTCEFCNAERTFDRVDVERLFKAGMQGSSDQH